MLIFDDGKVESKLEGYGPVFFLLYDLELMRVEVEVGEVSLKQEGVRDDVLGVVGGLKRDILFTLHDK